MIIETTIIGESRCPACDSKLGAVSSVDHAEKPRPGAITVCAYCGEVLQISASMVPEPIRPEVLEDLRARQPEDAQMVDRLSRKFCDAFANKVRTRVRGLRTGVLPIAGDVVAAGPSLTTPLQSLIYGNLTVALHQFEPDGDVWFLCRNVSQRQEWVVYRQALAVEIAAFAISGAFIVQPDRTFLAGIADGSSWIWCARCSSVSYNSNDVAKRYCARCYQFHEGRA